MTTSEKENEPYEKESISPVLPFKEKQQSCLWLNTDFDILKNMFQQCEMFGLWACLYVSLDGIFFCLLEESLIDL